MHAKFWSEDLKGGDYSDDLGTDGRMILHCILGKLAEKLWTEFTWLRIGTNGGL
jgi:hypothetical protein